MVSLQAAIAAIALSSTGQTVLLDFYADWCGPCRAMNTTVESLVDAGYPVQRVNIDQNRSLAAKYRVQSIPCFVMVVDGQEADRVVGGTSFSRLERMCKAGATRASPDQSQPMLAQNAPPAVQPPAFSSLAPATLSRQIEVQPVANQSVAPQAASTPRASDAALLAASVRLRVQDSDGHSCGSGTIIDARNGEALILTCGHIFRDSLGKGQIEVDLFGPNGQQRVSGRLITYDSEVRDIGLVAICTPGPIAAARVAPPGYRIEPNMSVVSVGCNNGDAPTARHSRITSLDKFTGPPNIQVAGQPVEGRSGGGLFTPEGYVIGVCNAADPSDREGLFAALSSICSELDRAELAFIYKSPNENSTGVPETVNPAAIAASPPPTMPKSMTGPADLASFDSPVTSSASAPLVLPPHEQAALQEIRRRAKEGADITIVIHPRNDPDARSEVLQLNRASSEFVHQLAGEAHRQETSLTLPKQTLPKPRRILLEWSAEKQ